jgi:nucleoid-associated protein YgaU
MMATVIESEQKQLDVDSISEYEREDDAAKPQIKSYAKDLLGSASEVISAARALKSAVLPMQAGTVCQSPIDRSIDNINNPKPDVLETLWPGIQQDFSHSVTVKRTPSYYLTLGFMGGAVIALIIAWGFSAVSTFFSNYGKVPSALNENKTTSSTVAVETTANASTRVPIASTYEVQDGDTLAGIALANYKHVSPRLLDEICKVNNLTDANVLSTGQKLVLPEYHY